jgi:hypothetical protein
MLSPVHEDVQYVDRCRHACEVDTNLIILETRDPGKVANFFPKGDNVIKPLPSAWFAHVPEMVRERWLAMVKACAQMIVGAAAGPNLELS